MNGDKARGGWTPWPVADGQLEISHDYLTAPFGEPQPAETDDDEPEEG